MQGEAQIMARVLAGQRPAAHAVSLRLLRNGLAGAPVGRQESIWQIPI